MKALTSFGLYSVWELQANNSLYKKFDGYNSHVMQSIGMGLCMHIIYKWPLYVPSFRCLPGQTSEQ